MVESKVGRRIEDDNKEEDTGEGDQGVDEEGLTLWEKKRGKKG